MWPVGAAVNLTLGVLSVAPITVTMMTAHQIAASAGWVLMAGVPFRDGAQPYIVMLVLTWTPFVPLAAVLNHLVVRRSSVRRVPYAVAAAVLNLLPYLAVCAYYGTVW